MELNDYVQYRETTRHATKGFDYNTYLCTIPLDFERVRMHWHDQFEIIYIKKGTGQVSINLTTFPVEAGTIIPVFPGELHAIEAPENRMEYENIIFSLSILEGTTKDDFCNTIIEQIRSERLKVERPLTPGTALHTAASAALDAADRACDKRPDGYPLLVKAELFHFLFALYTYRKDLPSGDSAHIGRLKSVISYVGDHYSEPITVAQAAEVTGYSAAHFMRIFKEETGQTFISYLTDYRLTAATYYLSETSENISGIATACGFDNLSYFIRQFRKKYGLSPREFRKNRAPAVEGSPA